MRSTYQHVAAHALRPALLLALLLSFTVITAPRPARAAGTVGNGTPTSCTEAALRSAVSAGGRVTFNCGANPVTITLGSQIELKANTEIDGGGKVTLSGGRRTRLLFQYNRSLTLRNITIRDGRSTKGGAIRSTGRSGVLNIFNSKFYNNDGTPVPDEENGGAISMHEGTLRIENSHFEGNRGINGGVLYNMLAGLTIINSTFINNDATAGGLKPSGWATQWGYGGAVYIDGASYKDSIPGQVIIRNSRFIGNKAYQNGGAVYTFLYTPDTALIEGSHFEGNVALLGNGSKASGGALMHHQGPLTLRHSTFVNNRSEDVGGAITVYQNSSGTAWQRSTITNVTITGNRAEAPNALKGLGGALFIRNGIVEIGNTTIASNYAETLGGAIYSMYDEVRLRNTIIAHNRLADTSKNSQQCYRAYSGSAYNIQTSGGIRCASGITTAEPKLSPLANNGGRTKTMALQSGSPAINRGNSCPSVDQRGAGRVSTCDIGAYEYGATAPSTAALTAPSIQDLSTEGGPTVYASWGAVSGATYYELETLPAGSLLDEAPILADEPAASAAAETAELTADAPAGMAGGELPSGAGEEWTDTEEVPDAPDAPADQVAADAGAELAAADATAASLPGAPSVLASDGPATALVLDVGSYSVRVRACNDEGCGPFSAARSVTVNVGPEKLFLVLLAGQ